MRCSIGDLLFLKRRLNESARLFHKLCKIDPETLQNGDSKAIILGEHRHQNMLGAGNGMQIFRLKREFARKPQNLLGARRESLCRRIMLQSATEDRTVFFKPNARLRQKPASRTVRDTQNREQKMLAADITRIVVLRRFLRELDRLTQMIGKK